eukprot:GHVU01168491.1.p1 GENE.GHVU01168491.1~~GHVU01168491.1.p1  ORF type:complete len:116 (-),score=3.77 GHVU01168491.1:35-382(-)
MNGRQHGLGVLRRPDGSVAYEGEWRNGKYHGLGVERFGNDVRYAGQSWNESINNAGQWEDGWLRGLGVARYPNGHVWHAGSWPREFRRDRSDRPGGIGVNNPRRRPRENGDSDSE